MRKNPVDFIRYELSPSNSAENIRHPSRTTVAKICCGNELSIPGDVVGFQGKVSGDHKIYHALSALEILCQRVTTVIDWLRSKEV